MLITCRVETRGGYPDEVHLEPFLTSRGSWELQATYTSHADHRNDFLTGFSLAAWDY